MAIPAQLVQRYWLEMLWAEKTLVYDDKGVDADAPLRLSRK